MPKDFVSPLADRLRTLGYGVHRLGHNQIRPGVSLSGNELLIPRSAIVFRTTSRDALLRQLVTSYAQELRETRRYFDATRDIAYPRDRLPIDERIEALEAALSDTTPTPCDNPPCACQHAHSMGCLSSGSSG